MEINDWLKIIKRCQKSDYKTGSMKIKIVVNPEKIIFQISKKIEEKFCKCCGADLTQKDNNSLIIEFSEKPNINTGLYGSLSVFQSNLLYMLFRNNKIPYDYAKYHECVAGKRFIENIKEIEVS